MGKKLWGGRFAKKIDPDFERFSSSIETDYRLARFDLIGSYLHVHVLKGAGLLTQAEFSRLKKGLRQLIAKFDKGLFPFDPSSEDIHTNIQNVLARISGPSVQKLQTCRSRNDQVVFATKLYCLFFGSEVRELIFVTQKNLLKLGALYDTLIMPGFTHLQHAQPVRFRNYLEAHALMFGRDADRLEDALGRLSITMGSGALSGTPIPASVYRAQMKKALKDLKLGALIPYISTPRNAISTVSDRDFAMELLSTFAILGNHISRLSEDLILWSTKEFGFVEVGDEFCTGSSLMPQKKNPDALELLRGSSGVLAGNLVSLLTVMKGLPLSYNRDMQWDKIPLFSSFRIARESMAVLAALLPTIKMNRENIEKQLADESLYATDLADHLVSCGTSFGRAHSLIGQLVKYAVENDKAIKDLSDSELKKFSPDLSRAGVLKCLSAVDSVAKKKSVG